MSQGQTTSSGAGLGVPGVILYYALARIAPGVAVPRLVSAMNGANEDGSTAAYMALVKLGPRIAPRILQEAKSGAHTASLMQLLGDLGDPGVAADLETFTHSENPEVAAAARSSLDVLRGEFSD